ncbi:MAG: DUF1802 family protein [Kaiparowitsia implicata GSE-PSE-MK54-09C]|jgi:hypothetical protein|nr:DUF1802 family protein [Kaiparowitsia implicata GSE-PSE-MK54-09C]
MQHSTTQGFSLTEPSLSSVPALKEWAIALEALTQGHTILLLRKGGIREQQGRFEVAHRQVVLYPTYEHQQSRWLKAGYREQVAPVASGWHPERLTLSAWAEITHIFQIREAATVAALQPHHIWTDEMVAERLRWKPQQPLYGLLLRTHRLAAPLQIPYRDAYGGCKSWLEVAVPADAVTFEPCPVLTDADYEGRAQAIAHLIRTHEQPANA